MDVIVVTIPATPAAIQVEVPGITGATSAYITNAELDVDNHLILTLSDTTEIDAGVMPPGPQGVSITGATVDGSYHLILSRSAGADIDAGYVRGPAGTNGTNGVSIVGATVDGSYHLILDLSSGPDIDAGYVRGPAGLDGTDGTNGTNGTDGVSITGAAVDGSYHLILTLSNSSTIDAGYVRGPAGSGDMTGPAGATAGNYPVLDATGNILSDSGTKPSDFATAAQGAKADTAVQPGDVHAATEKPTPADADEIGLFDSAASWVLKKLTWANLKATLNDTVYQPLNAQLTLLASTLSRGDGNFIVGDGTNWTVESGATARASLGLTINTHVQAYDPKLLAIAGLTASDGSFIVGDGTTWVIESGATARGSLGLGTAAVVNTGTGSGNVPVLDGSGKLNTSVYAGFTTSMFAANVVDNDGTLSANSSTRVATQFAVKTYVDGLIVANDAMVFKGVIDCSANPNYPAADRGWTYRVSVAGKIGGASGPNVENGDIIICMTDGTASGNHATVGAQWGIIQLNIDGALTTANIGSTVQAYDADLAAIAGQTFIAGSFVYWTASGAVAQTASTSYGRGLLNLADAAALRTVAALGTMATEASSNYVATTGAQNVGGVKTFTNGVTIGNSGEIIFSGLYGSSLIKSGTGDGASYTTHNIIFKGWFGMAMSTYDDSVQGFYNFRTGAWDVKGGYYVNGDPVATREATEIFSGGKTFTGGVTVQGTSPQIAFVDTDVATVGRNWWAQVNSDSFYILRDSDNTGGWDGNSPLQLVGSTQLAYVFGNQIITSAAAQNLNNPTIINGYTEETYSVNSGTALTIDLANGSQQVITLTGNVTFTFPAAATGKAFTLYLKQDATGGRTVTWPSSAKFPANTAPTITSTASKMDKISFQCPDGTNWIGVVNGQNYL